MRKADLIAAVAEELGLTYVKAEEAVNEILDTIKETLARGESVILRRFGGFDVRAKPPREGRNPKTASMLRWQLDAWCDLRSRLGSTSGNYLKAAVGGDSEAA